MSDVKKAISVQEHWGKRGEGKAYCWENTALRVSSAVGSVTNHTNQISRTNNYQ